MKYKINEIFYSLQGEGYYTGKPVIFIRFSGCNLDCDFCDTKHEDYKEMEFYDILQELAEYPCDHIVFTGGEPCLQLDNDLTTMLKNHKYYLQIETNGTISIPQGIDWITFSPKKDWILNKANELKVVYNTIDFNKIKDIEADYFYIQPQSNKNINEVINFIKSKENNRQWRLSLQTQKYLNIA